MLIRPRIWIRHGGWKVEVREITLDSVPLSTIRRRFVFSTRRKSLDFCSSRSYEKCHYFRFSRLRWAPIRTLRYWINFCVFPGSSSSTTCPGWYIVWSAFLFAVKTEVTEGVCSILVLDEPVSCTPGAGFRLSVCLYEAALDCHVSFCCGVSFCGAS